KSDFHKAFNWYSLAAQKGNALAQCKVGIMHFKGLGAALSPKLAYWWLKPSAEQGNGEAQFSLGILYVQGIKNSDIPKDFFRAHILFNLASSHASDPEIRSKALEARDLLSKKMRYDTVLEAQRQAKIWKPKKIPYIPISKINDPGVFPEFEKKW
ncbi:sel1 repeat family protein, partial [bacterium]|nr:sel1 repeat family protein [bacterium]